jgi:hypothetical protein
MGYKIERVQACFGFEVQGEETNKEYAIFLTIHESFQIRRRKLTQRSLRSRVQDMYRYMSFLGNFTYIDRYFSKTNKKYGETNQSPAFVPKQNAKDSEEWKAQARKRKKQQG